MSKNCFNPNPKVSRTEPPNYPSYWLPTHAIRTRFKSKTLVLCAFRLSASDVEACFREYDRDRDNRLNFEEFCVMMNAKRHSAQVNSAIKVIILFFCSTLSIACKYSADMLMLIPASVKFALPQTCGRTISSIKVPDPEALSRSSDCELQPWKGIFDRPPATCIKETLSPIDILPSLLVLCWHSLLTHMCKSCWADWPAQAGSNRKAGRGKSMMLKLLILYSIHATYGNLQMTEESNRIIYDSRRRFSWRCTKSLSRRRTSIARAAARAAAPTPTTRTTTRRRSPPRTRSSRPPQSTARAVAAAAGATRREHQNETLVPTFVWTNSTF